MRRNDFESERDHVKPMDIPAESRYTLKLLSDFITETKPLL